MFKQSTAIALVTLLAVTTRAADEKKENPADKVALQKLSKKIDSIEWNKLPLEKALADLEKLIGAKVPVDWKTLDSLGIKKSEEITLSLRGVTPIDVLHLIALRLLTVDTPYFSIGNGEISITSGEHAIKAPFLQTYDAGEFVHLGDDKKQNEASQNAFVDFIAAMVASESWDTTNGKPWPGAGPFTSGSIKFQDGKLVVINIDWIHAQLAGFLETLRGKGLQLTPERAAKDLLSKKIDEIKWDNLSLYEIKTDLAQKLGTAVELHINAFKEDYDPDRGMSLTARGVTLEELFLLVREERGAGSSLAPTMVGDSVLITYPRNHDPGIECIAYDVGDLIGKRAVELAKAHTINDEALGKLMAVIAQTIESQRWDSIAGKPWPDSGANPDFKIQSIGSKLIVRASRPTQLKIAKLFETLRKPNGVKELPAILSKNIPELTWDKVRLKDLFNDLEKKIGLKVYVSWHYIDLEREDKISLSLRNVNVAQAISMISTSVPPREDFSPFDATAVGDTICVMTSEAVKARVEVCVFEVADLLGENKKEPKENAGELMSFLAEVIDKESWARLDDRMPPGAGTAPFGAMSFYEGKLIVRATPQNQVAVAAMLAELRKKSPRPR